jgi:hypothetical protein
MLEFSRECKKDKTRQEAAIILPSTTTLAAGAPVLCWWLWKTIVCLERRTILSE